MALPRGYQQVEYIKSSGSQWIDTGVKPNQNTRVVMDMQGAPETVVSDLGMYFGASDSSESVKLMFGDASGSGWFNVAYYNTQSYGNSKETQANYLARKTIDFNKNTVTYGTESKTFTAGTYSVDYPITLFASNRAGSKKYLAKILVYSCKIYNNSSLIRDFVPARRQRDNVVGLYDLVTNAFYTNGGSGAFAAGPNVGLTGNRTLIDTTDYEIVKSKSMIAGVSYFVTKGPVLVDGVAYTIPVGAKDVSVQITGAGTYGSTEYAYVLVDGSKYTSATTISVPAGTEIACYVRGYKAWIYGEVYLNGVEKGNTGQYGLDTEIKNVYTHTTTKAATIKFEIRVYDGERAGIIRITE